ncbi:hypothetical protein NAP1_05095 [Erythrobacter sp. NAP1]|uniref:TraB/GumN family protein n=1 Tax=Erythrobacter sp. NAP1 TaxID=237727 RepID=UPI0000686A2C|nr:TraB/GumN family protein [Erythrobacter sp. NAP1]EAQ30125.1 hypothetical protein NAP1_05095 [Erythrobacter sp. NAP1]
MKLAHLLPTAAASLALIAASPALADAHMETAQAEAETVLPAGPEGPALWKVSDEDTTIYLFGTVHILPKELQWYDAEIDAALSSSDLVVTELMESPENEAKSQQLAMQMGMLEPGTTLRSLLDEEQTAQYEAALAGLGVPEAAFDPFKPWMASVTLTFLPLMANGYDPASGVDKVIIAKAGDTSKDALETVEFQLGIFDSLPQDEQLKLLMSTVEGVEEVKTMIDTMVDSWIKGDADGLAETMNESMSESPELAEALLYERNANWAEWIDARMDEPGTVFVAVGAGHLAGEMSVQDYLTKYDLTAERIQ